MRRLILVLFVVVVTLGALGGAVVYRRTEEPYKSYEGSEKFVEIPPGTTVAGIGRRLVDAGVVHDRLVFRIAVWASGDGRRLKAGEYRFDQPMTPADVAQTLVRGDVYLRPITFPEGLALTGMAEIFQERGWGPASSFLAAARNAEPIKALDPAARDLEGYLFPETYALPRNASAGDLVRAMADRFAKVFGPELRTEAQARGFSVREAVTLASLIEKETARPEERPLVAAVYLNRLKIGMGLQCDPTVIYALQRAGRYDGNLTREDLSFDSPYNTYRHAGLPPGPIAAPGRTSLQAAVRPASVDYLYFVSRNDGSHVFAKTLAEHNRNVQQYQIQYFRFSTSGQDGRRRPATGGQGLRTEKGRPDC